MSIVDAFGVDRPDLYIAKAGSPAPYSSDAGRKQRNTGAAASLLPFGGAIAGAHYAPKGHKTGGFFRAGGRGTLEGAGGGLAGQAAGAGISALSRGKIKPGQVRSLKQLGMYGGAAHGASASVGTTQRRYG